MCKKIFKNLLISEAITGMKLKLARNVHNFNFYKNFVFFVAIAHVLSLLWPLKAFTEWESFHQWESENRFYSRYIDKIFRETFLV